MEQSAAFDSSYYTRLGLESDPFAPGAMHEFFFVGAQRRFLVQRTVHALYFSGATVLLLGANGAGKTRVLAEIEKELQSLVDVCHIEATVLMDAAEIRALLVETLGLPRVVAIGNPELIHALERMRPSDGDPQPVLMTIDAAHLLSIDTLVECAALIASSGGRVRLLLAGEIDLAVSWQQAQAGAAEILELKPLDRSETEDYVRTKLQAAGYREELPLNNDMFDKLFAQSGGNFAAIDALVPQLLQPAPSEKTPVIRRLKTLPVLHIGIAAALLAIIILAAFYRGGSGSTSSAQAPSKIDNNQVQQTVVNKNGTDQSTVALQLPSPSIATNENANAPEAAASAHAESAEPAPVHPAPINPPPQSAPPENKSINNDAANDDKKLTAESKPSVVKKQSVEKKPSAQQKDIAEKPAAANKKEKHEETNKSAQIQQKVAATNAGMSGLNADEHALLAFPASNYVLQLIGAESKTTIDKFSKSVGGGVKLFCYRTQLHGKPWFIVVTGPYADKNAAQASLSKLPEAVRKQQPWARSVANVQADIRAHSGH